MCVWYVSYLSMVHYCLNLVKKVPCYVWGHGTLLLEVGQKSTMLKVGAKVQQKNDMCKEMPYFFEHTP